jgi:hypothetical protein
VSELYPSLGVLLTPIRCARGSEIETSNSINAIIAVTVPLRVRKVGRYWRAGFGGRRKAGDKP